MPINLIDKIKPKNGGAFAMVDAEDVEMPNGGRLSQFIPMQIVTQAQYDEMEENDTIPDGIVFGILEEGEEA